MVFNPLSKILHFNDAFDTGFGYLYGLVKVASQAIASLHTENPVKYQKLWDIFESKKGKIMNQTHKVAAFLNPAYMCSQIVQESETDEAINYMLEKFVCDDDKVGFVYDAVNYRRTLSNTTQQFKIIAAKTFIPCKWWKEFGHEFSVLSKYAVRILSQPCGSSSLKSSLRSFRDNQIKHRGFMPDLNALNLRINHFLMDKFSADKASQSKIINFEEFRQHKAMDDGSRNQVMEEARHSDEDTSLLLTSEEFIRSNGMKICFETTIASPIIVGQKVEGEQGSPIHVYLVDSVTNCVVQLPSMLTLTVSVLDGDFTNEGLSSSSSSSSDDGLCWTREHFDSNDLSSTMAAPLVTGDLQVMLQQGMGILGNFSFNYSSRDTRSGKFRLAVKTDAGNCQGIRTLEGISNAFVVEDCEVTTNQQLPTCDFNFPKDSDSSLNIFEPNEYWELESMLSDNSGPPVHWTPAWNNQLQCNTKSLTQTAAIKIKRKALKLSRMKKMRSRKTVGEEEREITVESTVSGDHHQVLERETTVKTTTVSGDHDQVLLNTKNNVDHQQCTKAVNDIVEHEIDPLWKLSDMKIVLGRLVARLEWYKKEAADEDVGYYDIYKNMQRPKDNDVVLLKKTLDNYWANLIAEVNKKPQKADAKLRKTWVYNNGTVYRRMIEPLHIAEYYKEKKGRYVEEGRPKFLQELEMLTDSHIPADEDPITRRRAMMHYNLTEDSCFWAHVEEAKLSCESLISGSTDDGDREKKVLEEFEKYGFEQMRNHGVSKEIFLKESSFMRWWELYQQVLKGTHMGPDHDSPLIEFMRNERYEEYKKGIYAPWED